MESPWEVPVEFYLLYMWVCVCALVSPCINAQWSSNHLSSSFKSNGKSLVGFYGYCVVFTVNVLLIRNHYNTPDPLSISRWFISPLRNNCSLLVL